MMPSDFFIGPIGPIEILTILATMIVWILAALSVAVRRQVGEVLVELPQSWPGIVLYWSPLALLAVSFVAQSGSNDFDLIALSRGPLAGLFLASLAAAQFLGLRFGQWTFGRLGLARHGLRVWTWDDLSGYRWTGADSEMLELSFQDRRGFVQVPQPLRPQVEALLQSHRAGVAV